MKKARKDERARPPEEEGSLTIDEWGVTRVAGGIHEAVAWKDLAWVRIYTTSAGPSVEDVFFALAGANGKGCLVPHGLAVRAKLLAVLQERLPGLDNDLVIRAMGSGGRDATSRSGRAGPRRTAPVERELRGEAGLSVVLRPGPAGRAPDPGRAWAASPASDSRSDFAARAPSSFAPTSATGSRAPRSAANRVAKQLALGGVDQRVALQDGVERGPEPLVADEMPFATTSIPSSQLLDGGADGGLRVLPRHRRRLPHRRSAAARGSFWAA